MKTHDWNDVKRRHHTDDELAELEAEATRELIAQDLAQLRSHSGRTQIEVGQRAEMNQALSKPTFSDSLCVLSLSSLSLLQSRQRDGVPGPVRRLSLEWTLRDRWGCGATWRNI